jgi:hypothetical protein
MKLISMVVAVAAFSLLAGCDVTVPVLISVEAVATANDTAMDAGLLGTWEEQGNKDLVAVIRMADSGGYQISILSGGSVMTFGAKVFFVKESEFLDLAPTDDNDFRIPGHAVVRIWTDGAALRWSFLDSDWLKQKAAGLTAHSADGKMQIFAPAATVRAFIAAYGTDDQAYGKVATWVRVP